MHPYFFNYFDTAVKQKCQTYSTDSNDKCGKTRYTMSTEEVITMENRILEAAKQVFVRKGYEATKMGDVAARSGYRAYGYIIIIVRKKCCSMRFSTS